MLQKSTQKLDPRENITGLQARVNGMQLFVAIGSGTDATLGRASHTLCPWRARSACVPFVRSW